MNPGCRTANSSEGEGERLCLGVSVFREGAGRAAGQRPPRARRGVREQKGGAEARDRSEGPLGIEEGAGQDL